MLRSQRQFLQSIILTQLLPTNCMYLYDEQLNLIMILLLTFTLRQLWAMHTVCNFRIYMQPANLIMTKSK